VRVHVDTLRCSGHAQCQAQAPEVFELDELGYNTIPVIEVARGQEDAARAGVAACPESALTIEE
jgi:ferredoxin